MFRRNRYMPWILLLTLLFVCFSSASASASAIAIIIPANRTSVEAKAYYGDTTLQAVVLQEGITSVGSQAFAHSSLTDITLPSTLTSIADDAFDGAPLTTVHAEKGSYAYQWMRKKGYLAEYRALLIGQQRFLWFFDEDDPSAGYGLDENEQRNINDISTMASALGNVIGPRGPYSSSEGAFQITRKTNLDYSAIRSAIQSTFADTQEQDISVFFIATHGQESGDGDLRTAFTGSITNPADINTYWSQRYLSFDTLASWLKTYVKGRVFVILESCGSGSSIYAEDVPENVMLPDNTEFVSRQSKAFKATDEASQAEQFVNKAIEVFSEADYGISVPSSRKAVPSPKKSTGNLRLPKFYVIAASRHHEKSYGWEAEDPKNSYNYFTKWLTEGIGSKDNSPADTNKNDYLTLNEMYSYVSQYDHITYKGVTYYQHVQRYPADSEDDLLKFPDSFSYSVTDIQGNPHELLSGKGIKYTVRRSIRDGETYDRYESVFVDKLALEPDCYSTGKGSLVLTLKSAYLDTLPEGTHQVLIRFNDGETKTSLTIQAKPKPVPETGDRSRPALWIGLILLGLAGLALSVRYRFVKRK